MQEVMMCHHIVDSHKAKGDSRGADQACIIVGSMPTRDRVGEVSQEETYIGEMVSMQELGQR